MTFSPIGEALNKKFQTQMTLQKQVLAARVVEEAESVFRDFFGPEVARSIKPLYLKNRTLTVTCSQSAVAQEIRLNQPALVQKINIKLGGSEVDRIRYLS